MPEALILTGQEFVPHLASKPAMGNVERTAVYRLSVALSSYLISPVKVSCAMTYRHLSYPFSPVFAEFEIRLGTGSLQWFLLNAGGAARLNFGKDNAVSSCRTQLNEVYSRNRGTRGQVGPFQPVIL